MNVKMSNRKYATTNNGDIIPGVYNYEYELDSENDANSILLLVTNFVNQRSGRIRRDNMNKKKIILEVHISNDILHTNLMNYIQSL